MKRLILILSMILSGMLTAGNFIKEDQNLSKVNSRHLSFNTGYQVSESGKFPDSPTKFLKDQFESKGNFTDPQNNLSVNRISQLPDWEAVINQSGTRLDAISSGDINGDGIGDVAVGIYDYFPDGAVFIFYGSVTGPSSIPDLVINGYRPFEWYSFGYSVSCEGDLNNDGFSDLIVGNPYYSLVHVYYGSAGGIIDTNGISISYGGIFNFFGNSVSSGGDVNGDGYDDLISSINYYSLDSNYVGALVFLGSAEGLTAENGPDWTASISNYEGVFSYCASITGDVNGDGFDDAVVSAKDAGKVFVYYGSSSRQMFQPADRVLFNNTSGFGSTVKLINDVNGDGYDEIAAGGDIQSPESFAYVYYGSQNGPSGNYDWSQSGMSHVFAYDINSAGDFNNDGFNDFLVSCFYPPSFNLPGVKVYFGSSTGLGITPLELNVPSFKLTKGEINGDGVSDILVTSNELFPKVYGFFGSADYTIPNILSLSPPQNAISVNRSSDISAVFDHDIDVSTINDSNIKVFGYETGAMECGISYDHSLKKINIDPANDFKTGERIIVTLTSGIRSPENIPVNPFTWTFTAQATAGTGVFTMTSTIDSSYFGNGINSICSGDIDSDGDPDLITGGSEILIFKNNGNAEFTLSQTIGIPNNEILTGDFDGDGDPDILCISTDLKLLKNDGNGNFVNSYSSAGYGYYGTSGDLDGDGDMDVAMVSQNHLKYYLNDGSGIFEEHLITFTDINQNPPILFDLNLGDMDNDGDLDLTLLLVQMHGFNYSDLYTLYNDGNANFGNAVSLDTYFGNSKTADLDGDKDLDILSNSKIFVNNGIGIFSPVTFSSSTYSDILPADYDADGDIDAVFTDKDLNNIKVYKNNSFGSLEFFSNYPAGNKPFKGTSADLDNDGDIDLMIVNECDDLSGSRISILLNNHNHQFSISGNSSILIGSENNIYVSSAERGFWEISNYDNTQASIPPDSDNDTIAVSAGDIPGHFVLYFNARCECGFDTLLSYHVYVDYPAPVELAAFTSVVNKRDVTLKWTTSSETNNSGFEIERAVDNGQLTVDSWSKVGNVEGSGTISEPREYTFTDKDLQSGNYKYRLKQTDFNGNFEYFELSESVSIGIPDKFSLSQNYPNPFNPVTNLGFGISELGYVTLKIYDVSGKEVVTLVNENKEPGYYTIKFNAANLAGGVYFYRMTVGDFVAVKKLVVLK